VADTRSGSSEERIWRVPESLRASLAQRYGPVYSGAEAEKRIRALRLFATCGDRVTELALRLGNLPLIGIVDRKTRRNEPINVKAFALLAQRRLRKVSNPPGTITESLRRAVRELVETGGGLIEVDGEEDLGSLALVESMPAGATVIYGIPGEGASFVTVDAVSKGHVKALIRQMEIERR
jgi:GTP-dependent dephospho-CoA kinase